MRMLTSLAVAAVVAITALAPADSAQAAGFGKRVVHHGAGDVYACQRLDSTSYGPIYRVKTTFVRTDFGPRVANAQVLRRYNSTESVQVGLQQSSDWWYGVHVFTSNASAVLGDRVVVWYFDGIGVVGKTSIVPASLPRCA